MERVYAPLGGDPVNGVSWKELNEAIAKAMQNYCGEQKRDELLLSGVDLLSRYEKEIVPRTYAANPHELMRLLEVFDILTVAQIILQACLARHQTCPKLEAVGHTARIQRYAACHAAAVRRREVHRLQPLHGGVHDRRDDPRRKGQPSRGILSR